MPRLRFPPFDQYEQPPRLITLVVADLPINRMVVGKIAAQAGLLIVESSSAEALAHFHAKAPSLVILDCANGVTPPFEALLQTFDESRRQRGMKVIMIHARDRSVDCGGSFSPDACISAPVTSDSLLPVIRMAASL